MPYIKEKRKQLNPCKEIVEPAISAGELNYQFTKLIHRYFKINGKSYQTMNDAIGALEGCKLELYRRVIAPYENIKIKQNGDV